MTTHKDTLERAADEHLNPSKPHYTARYDYFQRQLAQRQPQVPVRKEETKPCLQSSQVINRG